MTTDNTVEGGGGPRYALTEADIAEALAEFELNQLVDRAIKTADRILLERFQPEGEPS